MEGGPSNIETFDQFRERIKQLIDSGSPKEQVQIEFDRWYNRRFEETESPGTTISKRVEFQMELAHTYITMYEPDEVIDEALNRAMEQAEANKRAQEAQLRLITESSEKFIEWYLRVNKITVPMSVDEQSRFIAERIVMIQSEIEALSRLIRIMSPVQE